MEMTTSRNILGAVEDREVGSTLDAFEPGYKRVGEGWMQALTTLCGNGVSIRCDLTILLLRAMHQSAELIQKVWLSQFVTVMVRYI